MKWLVGITQLCLVVAMAGCTSVGTEYVLQNPEERRMANVEMLKSYQLEQERNGTIRQKTIYAYHFVPDTPLLTELGARELSILAKHYRDEVLPHLTKRNILKEVKVYFDYNKSEIRTDAIAELDEAIALLGSNPGADLIITGHADVRGSEDYNAALGERRSEAVMEYIADGGVNSERMQIVSRGKMDAMAGASDESGMQQDRNAHFMVAELQEFPVDLNVKQGEASDELYASRKKAVRQYLNDNGVDSDMIALINGLPGGNGMASGQAVVVLMNSYSNTTASEATTSSAATFSGSE